VARVLSTALALALIVGTAAAFVITEGAKLEKSPIARTQVTPIFSPDAVGRRTAHIDFALRTRERLEAWIQDGENRRVRTLQVARTFPRGAQLHLVWDGFSDEGIGEPDGTYMPVVKLLRSHRTIVIPSPIRLDSQPPKITVRHPLYPILSPDGDGRHDTFTITYRIDERARALLFVRGERVELTRRFQPLGELHWNGKLRNGRVARAGRYLMTVAARDEAGNQSKPFPFAIAQIRYVVLARDRVVVRPGARFALRVSTDAPSVHWTLHGRSGDQPAGTLHFRAPRSAGVYRLFVTVGNHAATCVVVVA
jgi:hypothetical protein